MQNKKKFVKQEKGAISTLVLFTVLVFLVILMGSYLITTTLLKSQLKSNLRIQQIYGQDVDNVDQIYEELALPRVANSKNKYFEKETVLLDSNDNKIVVPKGFKIANDSGDNVTDGIVIEDNDIIDEVGEGRGNQYVWIPVSNINQDGSNPIKKSIGEGKTENIEITLGRYEFADGTSTYKDNNGNNLGVLKKGEEILRQKAENADKIEVIESVFQELLTYRAGVAKEDFTGLNRTARELGIFVNSVEKNGGYYIARYEASYGKDNKPNSKISNGFIDVIGTIPTTEGYLWNNITQINAAQRCENMYDTISSDLVNSYAWDTAIVYIQKFSGDTDYSRQTSKNTSLANTGKNNDEVCKINDMASNIGEWTTEYTTATSSSYATPCVIRGGCYYNSSRDYTSIRHTDSATYTNWLRAFRPILYIK